MKKLYYLLLTFISISSFAQQATVASGKNATGSGGSSSYTVGQLVYTTNFGPNGSLAQGVQQPFEISTLGIDNFPEMNLQFSAHPNPMSEVLTLSVENHNTDSLSYQIFDIGGKSIQSNKVVGNQTQIDLISSATGIYFLNIIENTRTIKTFKIIKK